MKDLATFVALAYEDLADLDGLDGLEGLDEVMYQTAVLLALARADAEASSQTPGEDDEAATG